MQRIAVKAAGAVKLLGSVLIPTTPLSHERLNVCSTCPLLDKVTGKCTECGCYVNAKAKYENEHCPKGKW